MIDGTDMVVGYALARGGGVVIVMQFVSCSRRRGHVPSTSLMRTPWLLSMGIGNASVVDSNCRRASVG